MVRCPAPCDAPKEDPGLSEEESSSSVSQLVRPFGKMPPVPPPPLRSQAHQARADFEVQVQADHVAQARANRTGATSPGAMAHGAAADEYMEELLRFQENERMADREGTAGREATKEQPSNSTHGGREGAGEQVAAGDGLPAAKAPPVLPGAPCRRWFRIGARADFVNSIKPALHLLGMCEAKSAGEHAQQWHVYWSLPKWWSNPERFLGAELRDGVIINAIPGLYHALGDKPSLARLQVQCFEAFGYNSLAPLPRGSADCRFTARGFHVRRDNQTHAIQMAHRRFRDYNLASSPAERAGQGHNVWILKPVGGFNQVGIHMFNFVNAGDGASEASTLAWLQKHVPDGAWVLQEYVMDPLTFRGHKFDVRLWALVTSVEPLRVYVLRRGIPKISQMRYSAAPGTTKDQCMHILLPGTTECYRSKQAEVIWPYPNATDSEHFLAELGPVLGRKCDAACWWSTVWPSAEWRVVEVLLLARTRIMPLERRIQAAGKRYKRIVLLQPDLVFDSRGNAVLVECNMNGYMVGDAHKEYFSLQAETEALLELIGASGYPRQLRYATSLNARLDAFCEHEERGCTDTARLWTYSPSSLIRTLALE